MFTGLVLGERGLLSIEKGEEFAVLTFHLQDLLSEVSVGDSICVNGVCLTATKIESGIVSVDVMLQTLRLTNLGRLAVGDCLNLELALRAQDRLGGHLVQGHIDGVAKVLLRQKGEKWEKVEIEIPQDLMKYIVAQGSITVNGVSLTVGSLNDEENSIILWLIPETLSKTNLGSIKVGDILNIEVDILGKYIERLLEARGA